MLLMDERTGKYYATYSDEIVQRYDAIQAPLKRIMERSFDSGMRVLDVGAGSGRDLSVLLQMGCDAYGVEPCAALRSAAIRRHPELLARIGSAALPNLGQPFGGNFDAVVCSAVLMHLTRAEMLDAAIALRSVLKDGGRLLLSVPGERPGLDDNHRDGQGRLFTPIDPDYLQLLYERIGFFLLQRWESDDALERAGHSWRTFLFEARYPGSSRPLDQIEAILNRDRKTATYKLALFRALSEIATMEFDQARWLGDGMIGIPVASICEKWLYYYWPIVDSPVFIPQIRGETPLCAMPIAFRASLLELIQRYRSLGGFTRFVLDYRSQRLSGEAASLVERLFVQIRNTIVKGPVAHAGGSLDFGRVFQYDSRKKEVRLSAAIWRELSLVGHWIQDAVILRWAELTSNISKKQVRTSDAIELLLTTPIPERDVVDARSIYGRLSDKECTWVGIPIPKTFEVDHIIPFSLWRNNDLWNLVPTSPSVNAAKSDKLPSRHLLFGRREAIIHSWEVLRFARKARFDHEASRIAGRSQLSEESWQNDLFLSVYNAVEFTAAQRGLERWHP